jgi:hypothetical protein
MFQMHNPSRIAVLALTIAALPGSAIAETAKPCMTPAEVQNLITFAMPDIISGLATQCRQHIPASAFLSKSGGDLVARYRVTGDEAWPLAKKAMFKMIGDDKMAAAMPDEVTKGLLTAGISAGISKDIKSEDCGAISGVAEALAPLPPQNMATLIGVVLQMSSKKSGGKSKDSPFNICPAPVATN